MKKIIATMFLLSFAVLAANAAIPGTTVDSVLERDVMPSVKMIAKVKTNQMNCQNVVVRKAALTTPPTGYEQRGNGLVIATSPYVETWEVGVCGKTVLVPIHFVPDSTGTAFAVKSDKVQVK